jgi:predicted nucleic-acid-binding protein
MIGLDTSVLVRYIMQDDVGQSSKATARLDALTVDAPGWVSIVCVTELVWVLGACYGLDRAQLSDAVEALLRTKELTLEQAGTLWKALRIYRTTKADFADSLIACCAAAAGCEHTLTFDRAAARHAGMHLIA